jgi:hypothetical protein
MTIIIEKLMNLGGHNETQITAIEKLSPGRAFTIITSRTGHQGGSVIRSPLIAVLSNNRERKRTPALAIQNDVKQIEQFFGDRNLERFTPVLIPSADAHDIRVVLRLLHFNSEIAVFNLRLIIEHSIERLSEEELEALRGHVLAKRIVLLTETACLSGRLLAKYRLSAKPDFLLPCLAFPGDGPAAPEDIIHKRKYRIGYLGGLRKDKGAEIIPKILGALLEIMAANKDSMEIELVMQDHRTSKLRFKNILYEFRLLYSRFQAFRRNTGRITICRLPGYLSNEQFLEALRSVDLLIVPYDLKAYQFRGSGIIADGVLSLKPAVYTKGIGMSNFLEYGNGEAASTPREFAKGIIAITKKFEVYKRRAPMAHAAILAELQKVSNYLSAI